MTSYAVYDVDTGEVIHLHVEPAEFNSSPEEIIQLAGPRGSRRLNVVQVPSEGGISADAIRVADGRPLPTSEDVPTGAAGYSNGLIEPAIPRRYERHMPAGDEGTAAH
jgi:hypothetical protein